MINYNYPLVKPYYKRIKLVEGILYTSDRLPWKIFLYTDFTNHRVQWKLQDPGRLDRHHLAVSETVNNKIRLYVQYTRERIDEYKY